MKSRWSSGISWAASGVVGLFCSFAAQANLIVNGSFEDPASQGSPSLPIGSTYLTGWTVINAEMAQLCPGCFGVTASEGMYSLDFTGYHDAPPYGGVRQVISTVPFNVYKLSFDVGAISGVSGIDVSAGDLHHTAFSEASALTWTTFSSTFTALSSVTTIDLIGVQPSNGGRYIGLDNVIVTAVPIPPCTLAIQLRPTGPYRDSAKKETSLKQHQQRRWPSGRRNREGSRSRSTNNIEY
jgi:hypothetical protein